MKQVLRRGVKEIVVEEVPIPTVPPHHVLVQPAYSLISAGTEAASIHSEGAMMAVAKHPEHLAKIWKVLKEHGPVHTLAEIRAKLEEYSVLGYAGAGVVVETHASVRNFAPGDRVAYGGEGTGHGEYVVAATNYVVPVPEPVPLSAACFTTLGSIALNAVRKAELQLGDVVVVQGLGLVGQLISQLARLQGGVVVGTDLSDDRLQLARQLGAHHVARADMTPEQVVSAATHGRGADCVIIAAASQSSAPARQALQFCRERGQIVVVGAVPMTFPWEEMYLKEIRVAMARAYGAGCYDPRYERGDYDYPPSYVRWTANRNMEEFLRIVASGAVQIQPLISHQFPIEKAAQAYEAMMNPAVSSLAVVLQYSDDAQNDVLSRYRDGGPRKLEVPSVRPSRLSSGPKSGAVRVALVGAGNLARWVHLPAIKRLPGVDLRAVFSKSGPRGKNYAVRFGAEYCTTDLDEILLDPAIDMVVIASRHAEHCAQALAALRAGKHVFLEKPMAITEDECRLLCNAVAKGDRLLTVGFNRRFAPVYVGMKEQLRRRTGPAVIHCRVNSPGISGAYWMADPEIGGALVGEGCHFVDLMCWLLESEPVDISAFSFPRGQGEPAGENNVVASLLFADGSVGNLTYCTTGNKSGGGERVEAFAAGITVCAEDFKKLEINAGTRRTRHFWRPKKGYDDQMQAFVEAIRSGKPPSVTVRDGARATLGCLAILQAARGLEPCRLDVASRSAGAVPIAFPDYDVDAGVAADGDRVHRVDAVRTGA